ncbi:THUMP-like domain-containing protein [Nocardia stercoris]|uniref:Class I SAM-dependent methyltransferase n=1 Tax=Nocardia stercoris TaxID=2483361 RepID=A0A3M2LF26_9NOCA|nr:class I SAM-dependent methyltransferase [Nocardia stercoris]RMI35410.1 class I SAM-dependent methyltransferase [Nocardia stercoris]
MGYQFTRAEVGYLAGAAGQAALAEVGALPLSASSLVRDLEVARRTHGDRTGMLVETVRLRRRATAKLDPAIPWLLTDDALQQATPAPVARHRAQRLAGRSVHDVTCSVGAELVALARECPVVIGSDIDAVRLDMAAANLAAEQAVRLVRADALVPVTADPVVIADPARRAGGRRTHDPAALQPPLPDLLAAYHGRDLVVKCAPGLDFDTAGPDGSPWAGEVEVVSLDGSVREACLWSPGLAAPRVRRRATVLAADGTSWTLTDADPDGIEERAPGRWIVDPDGAVVRAGLVRHYAAKHGLWQLDPRIAYLTGDTVPPGVRGFEILERMDFREKPLRAALHRRDCGPLEILARGVPVDPDVLRAKLKPRGSVPHTVVVTRIGTTATAFVCATPPVQVRGVPA